MKAALVSTTKNNRNPEKKGDFAKSGADQLLMRLTSSGVLGA
jgi:hypothetical protein